jgi:hypothetical protein
MKVLTFVAGVVGLVLDAVFGGDEAVILRGEPEVLQVLLDDVDEDDLRRGYVLRRDVVSS